jgi:hypothetical protein
MESCRLIRKGGRDKMYKVLIRVVLITIIFLIGGCSNQIGNSNGKSLVDFYPGDISNVDHIEIRSGSTGDLVTITDLQQVQEWLSRVSTIEFIPDSNQEDKVGYLYYVDLFEGKERKLRFTPGDVEGTYYIYNKELEAEIQNLFNSQFQ